MPASRYVAILFCFLVHHMSQPRKSTTQGSRKTQLTAAGLIHWRWQKKHSSQLGLQSVCTLVNLATRDKKNILNIFCINHNCYLIALSRVSLYNLLCFPPKQSTWQNTQANVGLGKNSNWNNNGIFLFFKIDTCFLFNCGTFGTSPLSGYPFPFIRTAKFNILLLVMNYKHYFSEMGYLYMNSYTCRRCKK